MELTKTYQRISTGTLYYDGGAIGQIRTYARLVSQDKINNKTNYQLKQTIYYSSGYDNPRVFNNTSSTCDGTTKVYSKITIGLGAELTIQEISRTVNHNQDGTASSRTINTSFSASGGISTSASGSISFPSIDRYAYITGTLTSATDESTFYLDYANPLGLDMNVWLEVNPIGTHYAERTIGNDTSGRYTWTLSASDIENLQNAIPNSNTGTIRIGLRSTLDGVNGSSYKDIPFSIVNANPIFTSAYQDNNLTTIAITGDNQKIIQNKSTVLVSISSATALKGASLVSSTCVVNGTTYTSSIVGGSASFSIGAIDSSQNVVANLSVLDSRGNTTTQELTITMLEYHTPTAIITLNRKQNFYTETYITVDADYSSIDSLNTITIQYRYKKTSDETWGNWGNLTDNTQTSFNIDNRYEWNIEVKLTDVLSTTTYTGLKVGVGNPIFFVDKKHNSVSVNGLPNYDNSVEVNGVDISHTYETTERPIGRWIDGSIIYRKVIYEDVSNSASEQTINTGLTNVNEIWIENAWLKNSSSGWTRPMMFFSSSNYYLQIEPSTIKFRSYTSTANITLYVVVLYTKSV